MIEPSTSAVVTGRAIREIILKQSMRAHVGHIGSALSVADMVAALYGSILRIRTPDDPDRDRFVLSKGHAALAVYAAIALRGWISMAQLDSYCGDDSLLGVHPEHVLPGIDFCTGSLGHGLSMAAGAALAARFDGSSRRSFAIISDAEMNEGSTWEAVMFAAHHRLSNLYAILDLNGQQAFGYTRDVLAVPNAGERFSAFRWNVIEVDGHSIPSIVDAVGQPASDKPTVIVARTTFGKGVSYMENLIRWHYMPMSEAEYEQAMREVQST